MRSYAQNSEDLFIADYFKGFKGNLLSIGENDGVTLSNARLFLEKGWSGHLVEPSYVFNDLDKLYMSRQDVICHQLAIADAYGIVTLYESGAHVPGGKDRALVSSLDKAETERWTLAGVKFEERPIQTVPFATFWESIGKPRFDFISLDVEGYESIILKQMDLTALDCRCLCIEYNGHEHLRVRFANYCARFGLKEVLKNRENIIFIKN